MDVDDAFTENDSTIGLYAQLYTDDGDFDESDSLVRAGDTPVNTYFLVHQTEAAASTTTETLVRTPTTDNGVVTPSSPETTQRADSTTAPAASNSTVPGYGPTQAVVAVLVAVLVFARGT